MPLDNPLAPALLRTQHGVVSRRQALTGGLTNAAIEHRLSRGRWVRLHDGVYLTYPGFPTFLQLVWAGVLAAGNGAVASHGTAAALLGMSPPPSDGPVIVSVPVGQQPRRRTGLVVRRRRRIVAQPGSVPPHTGPVDTLLDLVADCRDPGDVAGLVTLHAGRGGVTLPGLRAELAARPLLKWRGLVLDLLEAVHDGVRSPLELRYRRDVEIAHGLPRPTRQSSRRGDRGQYLRDLEYELWRLVVELDGRLNHAETERVMRDMQRDNDATVTQRATLRYGWVDVVGRPCQVARQVATVLADRGWNGQPRRCGAGCTL